jgi:hypothetical protein
MRHHEHDEQRAAEQHHPGEHLGADEQLRGRERTERRPQPDRRSPLPHQDLVQEDEQPRQQEVQDQVGMMGVADHRRGEAVDEPAAGGRGVAGHVALDGQVGAPRREAVGQREQDVQRQDGPEHQRQRRQQQTRQRQPGVPPQVDAVRVVEVVADKGRDPVCDRERRPAKEPDEQARVANTGPERPVRGRGPGGPQQQHRQPEEQRQDEQLRPYGLEATGQAVR